MRTRVKQHEDELSPIRIGISRCLLGDPVRYDGAHKHDQFLTDTFGRYFEWVPVCPEVEVGMGTPREPIQLVQLGNNIRLLGRSSEMDHTNSMRGFAQRRCAQLDRLQLSGYILKKDSPSCGMDRVRVHHTTGRVTRSGRGLFANALMERFPNLPIEEEGRLRDLRIRENWIERVFVYRRLQVLWESRWRLADLVWLHTTLELTVLAHSPTAYRQLSQLVASGKSLPLPSLRAEYEGRCMAALAKIATRARHANVLSHMVGLFRDKLDAASRRELAFYVTQYRCGRVALAVPLTVVSRYTRIFEIKHLKSQTYLNPSPAELALRSITHSS